MPTEESVRALTALGFTGLEAEIYVYLLGEPPSTGYRIAQALGRPVANVYKALESLQSKAAIIVDEGETRLSRAVPAKELLQRLERDFAARAGQARDTLESVKAAPADARVYQLRTVEQVFERCRSMIGRARSLVLADLFPGPLEALREDIEAAAARGVTTIVKVFEPAEVAGTKVVLNPRGDELMSRYPGQWAVLVVDGGELLIAVLDRERRVVHQAIWSESATLSWIVNTSLAAEIMFCELSTEVVNATDLGSLKEAVRPLVEPGGEAAKRPAGDGETGFSLNEYMKCYSLSLPGFRTLLSQLGETAG